MPSLLIDLSTGEQAVITIDETGDYCNRARILWDTRRRGEMPPIELGKMQLDNGELIVLGDYTPEHAAFLATKQAAAEEQLKKVELGNDINHDAILATIRDMGPTEVDQWFLTNVTDAEQAITLLKKIVKSLIEKNLL